MKKQVLFIVVAAFFAGNMAFGQICAVPGSPTRGTNCVSNALAPIGGNAYTYQAAGDPAGGTFLFWATKDRNFIATDGAGVTTNNLASRLVTPDELTATSANYGVADLADQVSITWSDATLAATTTADPTFVAVYYTAPAAGCADNFNAWEIVPVNAFIVDVRNIHDYSLAIEDYDVTVDECVDQVRGATYAGGSIVYDFGSDTLYYEVVAANFTVSWTPNLTVTGTHAAQTTDITWTCDKPATWGAGTTWNPAATVATTTETNTSLGVSIYVRVIVTHHDFENNATARPTGITITLVVDGTNSVSQFDIENNTLSDHGPLCNQTTGPDGMDVALQTLKPRPALTAVTPTPFIPGIKQN